MGRSCSICESAERDAIDRALVGAASLRDMAAKFRVSEDSLARHKAGHLPLMLVQAESEAEIARARGLVAEGLDVVAQLRAVNAATLAILDAARESDNHELALRAVDRIQRQLELQAKLLGELDERPQINILASPEWVRVRTTIMQALLPFGDARIAVAAALDAVDGRDG